MAEVLWIREDVVYAIHHRQIEEHGGTHGIRNHYLLLSALDRPKNLHVYSEDFPDIADLASAYAYGIARNHPFLDGNKRVALVTCRTFLKINGYDIQATQDEKHNVFMLLARGDLTENQLAIWFRERIYAL